MVLRIHINVIGKHKNVKRKHKNVKILGATQESREGSDGTRYRGRSDLEAADASDAVDAKFRHLDSAISADS